MVGYLRHCHPSYSAADWSVSVSEPTGCCQSQAPIPEVFASIRSAASTVVEVFAIAATAAAGHLNLLYPAKNKNPTNLEVFPERMERKLMLRKAGVVFLVYTLINN